MTDGQTYLVTGGAGFIGSHLADALLAAGHRVVAVDDLSTGSLRNVQHLRQHERFQLVRASIRDPLVVDRLASDADVIVHLAAAVGVKLIVDRRVHTLETNVMGTETVLRAGLRYDRRVLLASTSEAYGKGSRVPFSEDDDVLLGSTSKPRWGYAISKLLDECMGLAYHSEYGLPVVPFRLFNTTGARQSGAYGMVVPRFVRAALAGEPITVHGDGSQRRCFCDVRDVVQALVGLAEHPQAPGRIFNVGSNEEVSVLELAQRVKAITGSSSPITHVSHAEVYGADFEDMQRRVPDIARVRTLLGWAPKYSLDEIIRSIMQHEQGVAP